MKPRQNNRHFADDIITCITMNRNVWILLISLKIVRKMQIDHNLASVQIMAWCRKGHKPFLEPMLFSLLTHICATGLQWVKLPRSMLKTKECVTTSQHFTSRDIQSIFIEWHMGLLKKALHQRANSLIRIDVKYPGWLICYLHGIYCDYTALGMALNIPDQWMLRDWT